MTSTIWSHFLFYLGLGALLTVEEAGVFLLPGDISIVGAGVYAAQGGPFIVFAWLIASAGMIAGASVLFFAVRRSRSSGRALPDRLRALALRHGAWGVGAARLVPGLRNATVFTAAAAYLPPYKFFFGLVPAALLWAGALLLLGWFGGTTILSALGHLNGEPALKVVAILLVTFAAVYWLGRMRATRSSEL